jgi:hypothetical protein
MGEGNKGEHGGKRGENNGARSLDSGLDNRVIVIETCNAVLPDLLNENHAHVTTPPSDHAAPINHKRVADPIQPVSQSESDTLTEERPARNVAPLRSAERRRSCTIGRRGRSPSAATLQGNNCVFCCVVVQEGVPLDGSRGGVPYAA